mgnify:CR=1 FL=1
MDKYIRERLFGQPFEPMLNNNWKILLAHSAVATRHIIEQLTKVLHYAQQEIDIKDATIKTLEESVATLNKNIASLQSEISSLKKN